MAKKVIVADDSQTMRKAIGLVLPHDAFQVVVVDNGLDCLTKARELKPDLVLADTSMPGKSGYEVAQALKTDPSTQAIPVVLLAGSFEPFDEGKAQMCGAVGHIAKPFESEALLAKLSQVLGIAVSGPKASAGAPAPTATAPMRPSMPMAPTGHAAMPAQRPPAASVPPPPAPGRAVAPQGLPIQQPGIRPPMPGMQPPPGATAPQRPGQMPGAPGQMMPPGFQPRPPGSVPPGATAGVPARPAMPIGGQMGMAPPQPGMARPPMPGMMPPPGMAQQMRPMMPGAQPMPMMRPSMPGMPMGQMPGQAPQAARPADGGEALLREALSKASKEVIEKIAWEVVPQLAEAMIREELDRLIKAKEKG